MLYNNNGLSSGALRARGFLCPPLVGTITAVDTFLGALLGISAANYYKAKTSQNNK